MAVKKKTLWRGQSFNNPAAIAAADRLLIVNTATDERRGTDENGQPLQFNEAELINRSAVDWRIDVRLKSNPQFETIVPSGASWILETEDDESFNGDVGITNLSALVEVAIGEIYFNKAVKRIV